ncbi:hypothetical protein ANN_27547 [Periplaneta americana]|uniref:Uncharacterized protein n=1 Tax=Periplaneta americana TaxID=6978 RepID=A0ABQ8RW16_PERAM|nr:hypothetical protein ANN_27547 [Periplaneta americana]
MVKAMENRNEHRWFESTSLARWNMICSIPVALNERARFFERESGLSLAETEKKILVMDAIKTEPKIDPLAEQSCDDSVMEEANSSPDKDTAMESHDSSCDFKCDVKIEETKDPITFPMMKCELEIFGQQTG